MLEQTLDCLVDSGGCDAAAACGAPGRARGLPGRPAAAQAPVPPPARLHRGGPGAAVPAGRRWRGRRRARPRRRQVAGRVRQSGVPSAGGHAVAAAAGRLRSRALPRSASVSAPIATAPEGGQARPGAAARSDRPGTQPRRRRPPPGWCATSSTRRPTCSDRSNLPEFAVSLGKRYGAATEIVADDALDDGLSRPSRRSAAARRDRRASRSSAGPAARPTPTRRSFRCAARASASIPAATTSSRRAACCG